MAQNEALKKAVLQAMCGYLIKNDLFFLRGCGGNEESGISILDYQSEIKVDSPHKVRVHFGRVIGYGYDFGKTDEDGEQAKDVYERAVKNTKARPFGEHGEELLSEGVADEKFGWYITV